MFVHHRPVGKGPAVVCTSSFCVTLQGLYIPRPVHEYVHLRSMFCTCIIDDRINVLYSLLCYQQPQKELTMYTVRLYNYVLSYQSEL